ncbi:MAG: hypothetical protein KF746_11500 [Chitinophagaceae bacterium]|nr:hypothetical protein [Chitinophagaceae bacterium]
MNRRMFLTRSTLSVALLAIGEERGIAGKNSEEFRDLVTSYLESLAKSDGGYGYAEQPDSFLPVTYAVVGAYRMIDREVPNSKNVAEFIRQHHPFYGDKPETARHHAEIKEYFFQQIQALLWLGYAVDDFRETVMKWKTVSGYVIGYERGGNPILRQEAQPILCRELMKLPVDDLKASFGAYFAARRRVNGTFNNTPASDGSEGHLVNTLFGLEVESALGLKADASVVRWIKKCQRADGGFGWCPQPDLGDISDVSYTVAGLEALNLLNEKPARANACRRWLQTLWNNDGGFADRPGAYSTAMATFQALKCFRLLGVSPVPAQRSQRPKGNPLPADLKAFTIQIEAPGYGSPLETVAIAKSLGIHLWGAKNADPAWVSHTQALAQQQKVPVTFFQSNEDYDAVINIPGIGSYTHMSDTIAPSGKPLQNWPRKTGRWQEFFEENVMPLHKQNGRLAWQICDNEEFSRILLDESIQHGGYDMISTFHFHAPNLASAVPFTARYQHDIPFVALQDAHSEAWWWRPFLTGFRTVFLGKEPSWEGWLEALEKKRVVAVRRDKLTYGKTRMLGGSPEVRRRIAELEHQWQWWSEQTAAQYARASVVALDPSSLFEPGKPDNGRQLRIRIAREWFALTQLSQQARWQLSTLKYNGDPLSFEESLLRDGKGNIIDASYLAKMDQHLKNDALLYLEFYDSVKHVSFTRHIRLSAEPAFLSAE